MTSTQAITLYVLWFKKVVVDAVLAIRQPDKPIDLHMVEIMEMMHKSGTDTS